MTRLFFIIIDIGQIKRGCRAQTGRILRRQLGLDARAEPQVDHTGDTRLADAHAEIATDLSQQASWWRGDN